MLLKVLRGFLVFLNVVDIFWGVKMWFGFHGSAVEQNGRWLRNWENEVLSKSRICFFDVAGVSNSYVDCEKRTDLGMCCYFHPHSEFFLSVQQCSGLLISTPALIYLLSQVSSIFIGNFVNDIFRHYWVWGRQTAERTYWKLEHMCIS